jgi:hypothetical protein
MFAYRGGAVGPPRAALMSSIAFSSKALALVASSIRKLSRALPWMKNRVAPSRASTFSL